MDCEKVGIRDKSFNGQTQEILKYSKGRVNKNILSEVEVKCKKIE